MMQQQMQMPPRRSIWYSLWAEMRFHSSDFIQLPALAAGIYLFFWVIFGGAIVLFDDATMDSEMFAVLGIMPFVIGVMVVTLTYGGQLTIFHNMGVQMSITRRGMIARSLWIGVLQQGAWLLTSFALYGLTHLIAHSVGVEMVSIFAEDIPHVVYLLIIMIPISLGTVGAGVMMRFGRKGFWVLYFVFLSLMVGPSAFPALLEDNGPFGFVWQFVETLHFSVMGVGFWGVAVLLSIPLLVGIGLLWRAPVKG